jgi:23S rRNA pseudouridine1911/1915/1917 synthase
VDVTRGGEKPARVVIPDDYAGARLDGALAELTGLSRSRLHELIAEGAVTRAGRPVKKSLAAHAGWVIDISYPLPPVPLQPSESPDPTVLHIDDDVVVIDKPPELAVHPAPGWDGPTVLSSLHKAGITLSDLGPEDRRGVVHRLDVGTSGVMVLARSDRAYQALKAAFHDREVEKIYHALVQGYPSPSSGTIDAPVGRHPTSSWRFAVVRDGKNAITHYDTLEVFPGATLVEVHLETGRTHQIRVHFQAERHPLVGDSLYGADPRFAASLGLTRQWLHAKVLSFVHPGTLQRLRVESEYPEDLAHALQVLDPD